MNISEIINNNISKKMSIVGVSLAAISTLPLSAIDTYCLTAITIVYVVSQAVIDKIK